MFKIGEFSKLSGLSVKALRHYEDLNLLKPIKIDEHNGYRYYSSEQLILVNKIKSLQNMGLSLQDIKAVIEDESLLKYKVEKRLKDIDFEIDELSLQKENIKLYSEKENPTYDIILKHIPPRKVMSSRMRIDSYYDEHILWDKLYDYSIKNNIKSKTPHFGMTIFHDIEYVESNIDVEVQSDVSKLYESTDDIKFYESEGFELASIIFKGSYKQMDQVVEALAIWIENNNYEIVGPMINIAHQSPATVRSKEDYLTESGYIVKKKGRLNDRN